MLATAWREQSYTRRERENEWMYQLPNQCHWQIQMWYYQKRKHHLNFYTISHSSEKTIIIPICKTVDLRTLPMKRTDCPTFHPFQVQFLDSSSPIKRYTSVPFVFNLRFLYLFGAVPPVPRFLKSNSWVRWWYKMFLCICISGEYIWLLTKPSLRCPVAVWVFSGRTQWSILQEFGVWGEKMWDGGQKYS